MPFKKNDKSKYIILDNALECFYQYGINGTTIADIAREAGVNKALVYYYFSDKQGLLHQLVDYQLQKIYDAITSEAFDNGDSKSVGQKLKHLLSPHHKFFVFLFRECSYPINGFLIERVIDFLFEKNINLQSLFNQYFGEELSEFSNRNQRETLYTILAIIYTRFLSAGTIEKMLSITPQQETQFFRQFESFIFSLFFKEKK